jgi:hypothetical protein
MCMHFVVMVLQYLIKGMWSEIPLASACTVTLGNFSSHSVVAKILSSFLYVGVCKLLTQVQCLPVILLNLIYL